MTDRIIYSEIWYLFRIWPEFDPGTAFVNCKSVYLLFSIYDNDVDIQT